MASSPTQPNSLQPAFRRIAQQDRHDDTFAVISMLTGRTLDVVLRQAETHGLPKSGPYFPWIDGDLIAKVLAANGLVATVWKECSSYKELPEVAIALVQYDEEWEVGRCVLYHRNSSSDGKSSQPYVIDPYPHTDTKQHMRAGADLVGLPPAWFIGVSQMAKGAGK